MMILATFVIFLVKLPMAETAPIKAIEEPGVCRLPPGQSDLADLVAASYQAMTGRVPMNVKKRVI